MQQISDALGATLNFVRSGFLIVAITVAAICGLDWLVRTRRVSPFGPLARLMRQTVDPLLRPVERLVVRRGGLPANAPWWALGAVAIAGIILISLLEFARSQVAYVALATRAGSSGLFHLLVTWTFGLLQLALIVRVVLTWVSVRPGTWYARWSFRLTEPLLRPLRRVIPQLGMVDITPIVAWFVLMLLRSWLLRLGA